MTSSYKEIYMQHILQKITILIMYVFITQRHQNIIIYNLNIIYSMQNII